MGPLMKTPRSMVADGQNAAAMTRTTLERVMSFGGLLAALSMIAAILAGCTTTGGKGGSFCDTAQAMRPSADALAVMSDREVEEMLAHNKHGERSCGWRP